METNKIYKQSLGSKVNQDALKLFVCMKNTYNNTMTKHERVKHTLGDWRISETNRNLITEYLTNGDQVVVVGVSKDEFGDYVTKTCFEVYGYHVIEEEGIKRTIFHQIDELRHADIGIKYDGGKFDRGYGTVKISK